jgi:hypothetical protein
LPYTERNIEDWDFRGCFNADGKRLLNTHDNLDASLFLSTHFTNVIGTDSLWVSIIAELLDRGIVTLEDDRQHVRFYDGDWEEKPIELLLSRGDPDKLLKGFVKGSAPRFTRGGRGYRRIAEAMRREYRRDGRLRTTLLPANYQVRGFPRQLPF